ncbi:unnamed protein product [Brachionus calyciflorus]|uniref:Phosphatidylinositol N-acetylglucosaminyltransferase subunit C n=1 Tax=Brachionus calyciflorus TaxID=104777 RepID=A0A813MJH3_9BILA|nr:unnamed protein product [Brachionus calyciflorus]
MGKIDVKPSVNRQNSWTKKLYIKQSYDDNYVDEKTFLELKRINVNARLYTYWEAVLYSGLIVQQLSTVIIFVLIYVYLRSDLIKIENLVLFFVVPLVGIGYLSKVIVLKHKCSQIQSDLGNIIKFVLFTYGISPIVNSLTESISSDTIHALTTFMLIFNILFYDYDSSEATIASKTFSFNAALFACVCLASRFEKSSFHTFILLILAFVLFALFPEYRRYSEEHYPHSIPIFTITCFFICLIMMINLKLWLYIFYLCLVCFIISFVCPLILIKLQSKKKTIHGPWDEALIQT